MFKPKLQSDSKPFSELSFEMQISGERIGRGPIVPSLDPEIHPDPDKTDCST